jgi:hypothetical protein
MPARTAPAAKRRPRVKAADVKDQLAWSIEELAAMLGVTDPTIYRDRLDSEHGQVMAPGGALLPIFKDPKNGQWVAYRAQVERALAEHGHTTAVTA